MYTKSTLMFITLMNIQKGFSNKEREFKKMERGKHNYL